MYLGQPKDTYDPDISIVSEFSICGVVFVSLMMSNFSLMANMIRDKSSGIKEVLNANGQRRSVYITSVLFYHILLNLFSCVMYGYAIIQIYFLRNDEVSMLSVIGLLLISNIANITFSMSFSTLFESSKLAAYS